MASILHKLKKHVYYLFNFLFKEKWGKRLFAKRNESQQINQGFKAGLTVGILHTIYMLLDLWIFKGKYIQEIKRGMAHVNATGVEGSYLQSLSVDSILWLAAITLPFFVIGIYSVVGILLGMIIERYEWCNNFVVLLVGWGLSGFFVSDTYQSVFIDILFAIMFGLLFMIIFSSQGELTGAGEKDE